MKPADIKKLKATLTKEFTATNVQAERIGPARSGRYRIAVISPKFKKMPHMTRQDKVWKIVDQAVAQGHLPRETPIDISLILAYAPDEVELVHE